MSPNTTGEQSCQLKFSCPLLRWRSGCCFGSAKPYLKPTNLRVQASASSSLDLGVAELVRVRVFQVLEACPDAEWRLLFALSRFGGLRCPSEHLALTWSDVDWERDRFRVTSPKTEHHEGKGGRWVPIFPELRPYLEEAFELATEGAVFVINRYRDRNSNLRTQLNRIIRRAGLEPWPKLFHNLRASRETELAETFPVHVVCAWIGNTERIAAKHYLQVTEDHFALAITKMEAQKSGAQNGAQNGKTAQNTAQHGTRTEHAPNEKTPEIPGFSAISPGFSAICKYPQPDSNRCLLAENQTS